MKVAVYYSNTDIRIEERPIPEIKNDEVLIKVRASGICGSDVMEWYRIKKAPRVLGHEVAGEVVKTGESIAQYKKGDRVFVTHHVPCNTCHYCRSGEHTVCNTLRTTNFYPGGFAEYIRVPNINVERGMLPLPNEISYDEGTFIEPLGCVVRGQRKVGIGEGQTVLVIGSGLSGILHIQLARVYGAKKVIATDVKEQRLKAAERFGADVAVHAREDIAKSVREENEGRLADRVIVCTGALSAIKQGLGAVDRGGRVLFFAPTEPGTEVPLPFNDLWFKCATITTTYAAVMHDLREALELIRTRKVNVADMITHRLPLEDIQKGFDLVAKGEESLKVIIEM